MMDALPTMSRVEESRFWETHDATDYLDVMEPVSVTVGPRPRNRCPKCRKTLLSRYVDVQLGWRSSAIARSAPVLLPGRA